jgi:DUF1365 family protein
MLYLDLAELESAFSGSWLWSARRPALARFRREDHLGDPAVPLDTAVRDLVAASTGRRPRGPIRLLTQPRCFGYSFNPVSLYYCFDEADRQIDAIVAEVSNTPWGERHCYVLDAQASPADSATLRFHPRKVFHVSPFMPMDVCYIWHFSKPDRRLLVHMENRSDDVKLFDATLVLERRELSRATRAKTLCAYPFVSGKTILGIYWEALRLWLKRTPFFDHPDRIADPARSRP